MFDLSMIRTRRALVSSTLRGGQLERDAVQSIAELIESEQRLGEHHRPAHGREAGGKGRALAPRRAILGRRRAERSAEAVVEGREVAEAAVERDGQHRPTGRGELERGATHSGAMRY